MGRALPEPPQPGARHVRWVAGAQPPRLQLPSRRAERGARRRAGCPFGRAPRQARAGGGLVRRAACRARGRGTAGARALDHAHELVRLRRTARAAPRPRRGDSRARGARHPGTALFSAHSSAAVLSRQVRSPAGRFPGDRGRGRELPRAALLRNHARGTGRHGLWGARRGPGTRAQRGYHGAARRRVGEGTMSHGTSLLLRHRAAITTLFNLTLATAAWVLAFALRFDLSVPERYVPVVLALLPVLLGCTLAGFAAFRLSKGWWRHVSIRDLEDIVRGNVLASTLFLASVVFVRGLAGFPRSVFLLDLLLSTVLMAGVRVGIRLVREQRRRAGAPEITTLALIVGAGSAGIRLLGEIESRRRLRLAVVGFVDDDVSKVGLRVCGTPVLGRIDDLPALVAEHGVGEVLIAIPSASPVLLRRVVQHCTEARVRHRVLPTLSELVEGSVIYTQMREVKVDDLLAREPIQLDVARVHSLVTGKTVLVTGAAGSIGSELCRQLAAHEPERLILYDRHENGVFVLEMELQARFPRVPLVPVLGTVLLEDQLRTVFAAHRPDLVFHAAAYKHLPMAERNVLETIRNNVIGTRNVAQAAIEHGAQEFILVSTDKAVLPTSIMGATKREAEMIVQELGNRGCRFVAVRFGNVLGSSGSVVPLFREQIARGGPVTVTDPEVTRYFMTIPEAAQLILQAAALGRGGEVFILDMGQPVRILDLARQMIRLSGFEPDEDIPISFIGLRPGEKLHEELMTAEEEVAATQHDRIKVVRASGLQTWPDIWLPRLQACVERGDVGAALQLLQTVIPAYRPSALITTEALRVSRDGDRRLSTGTDPVVPQRPAADRVRPQPLRVGET